MTHIVLFLSFELATRPAHIVYLVRQVSFIKALVDAVTPLKIYNVAVTQV